MIQGKKVLGVIPARGGSKGVPGKNIRQVAGKPLIAWTIEAAKKSKYLDRLILSSDDAEIISVAEEWGADVPFIRPEALAHDETPGIEPLLHAIKELPGYDYVVLLQPTSPLRTTDDIDRCLELSLKGGAPTCVSVTEAIHNPYLMYTMEGETLHSLLKGESFARRQEMPVVYVLNGAVYVAKIEWLLKEKILIAESTIAYKMPKQRSVDVDEEIDLYVCESLFRMKNKEMLDAVTRTN